MSNKEAIIKIQDKIARIENKIKTLQGNPNDTETDFSKGIFSNEDQIFQLENDLDELHNRLSILGYKKGQKKIVLK